MPENAYNHVSFWLNDAGESLTPRPALQRSEDVDIAILGGGYSGLWTAYYLLRTHPGLRVAIVEKEIVGYGGSGRNGGWCSPRFPVSAAALHKRFGESAAQATLSAVQASVDEIQIICAQENIDANFRAGGTLTLARSAAQLASIRASHAAYAHLGLADRYQLLTPDEAAERIRVTKVHGALYTPDGASIHPGRLVRGLARAVEAHGGTIYEQTAVTEYQGGSNPRLITPNGELRARKAIVLAGEAYLTRFPKLHRTVLPVYSLICLTEPLSPEQWLRIGWQQGENVASARSSVVYLTRTPDGRILFGSRGAPYAFGSKITDAQDRHAATIRAIQSYLFDWFPSLAGIKFTEAWGGPVAMPIDWMPSVNFDPKTRIATIGGYTGQGVSTSNLAGKLLAGRITQTPTGLESLPLAQHRSPQWIPEPLRWLIVRYMQHALLRIDEADEANRPRPLDAPLAEYLGRH
jgi:glycine/D-amino acid oxidase-like deaminating enzyme